MGEKHGAGTQFNPFDRKLSLLHKGIYSSIPLVSICIQWLLSSIFSKYLGLFQKIPSEREANSLFLSMRQGLAQRMTSWVPDLGCSPTKLAQWYWVLFCSPQNVFGIDNWVESVWWGGGAKILRSCPFYTCYMESLFFWPPPPDDNFWKSP